MIRFSIFGIQVEVQPFFWVTSALLGGAIDARTPESILKVVLFMLAAFISILVHELGHAMTARKFGIPSDIVLQAFGGYATLPGPGLTRFRDFLVTAAGPAIQIVLGMAVFAVWIFGPEFTPTAEKFLKTLIYISVFWAVLNLLPVLPLDGGRLLNAVLGPARIRTTLWTTIIVSCGMAILMLKFTHSVLFAFFLLTFAWQAWQALQEHRRF